MAILSTELVAYAAANMPTNEGSTVGGAIDPLRRVVWSTGDIASADTIQAVSSNAADLMNITVTGRTAAGIFVTETKTLNGSTPITFTVLSTVERVLSADLASTAVGTVSVQRTTGSVVVSTIPSGERGFMRMFINSYSDLIIPKPYWMKFFWKNTNATLALINPLVKQSADPTGLITHVLANIVDDAGTSTNRLAVPLNAVLDTYNIFDDTDKWITGSTSLAAGSAVGVWLKFSLAIANAPLKSTYTSQLFGLST